MNDINLLPEELRNEDARQSGQAPSLGPKPTWHLPGNNGNGDRVLPVQPSPDQNKVGASVLSVEPAGKAKIDFKPIVPIFDFDAEAKKSALPQELSASKTVPSASRPVASKNGNGQILSSRPKSNGNGLLSRLFGKKERGMIISNKSDNNLAPAGYDKNVDVNLIPEGSDLLPNNHFYPYFIYAALGGLAIIGLLFVGLALYQQKISGQEEEVTAKVNESEMVYNQLKAKEEALSAWSKKVAAIQTLLDNHVYWTNFFAKLQQITSPAVYYKDINTAVDGTVTLSAVASSYLAVAKQYLAYQQADQIIKEVKIANLAGDANSGEIGFSVNLRFFPEVFFLTANSD